MTVHMRDIRLRVNAGIDLPVCQSNRRLLPSLGPRTKISDKLAEVTCKRCLSQFKRRYPWAKGA